MIRTLSAKLPPPPLLLLLVASAQSFQGIFSGQLSDFEVVVPRKIGAGGLEQHHPVSPWHPGRSKRATLDEHKVQFEVPLRDASLMLELWPSVDFISSGLSVQRPRGRRRRSAGAAFHSCHFQGVVQGEPGSTVALSACAGLAGMVRSERHGTLWIEPIRNGGVKGHQHVIYKRPSSSAESASHSCGTDEPPRIFKKPDASRSVRQKRSTSQEQYEENFLLPEELATRRPYSGHGFKGENPHAFSVSKERNVEVMVVADRSMMDFHDKESASDLETYLLTVMNMVSAFYRIPSLGNRVNIVVAKLRVEDESMQSGISFNVTTNADKTLDSFCLWQKKANNPDDDHPDHHDVAILLTRVDICSKSDLPCGTLGVAHVGGMCDLNRACSVNQDNGLSVAHTVAHELGHNFGMVHDAGDESNNADDCLSRNGTALHIMTPNFDVETTSMEWSSCSRKAITRFFDKGDGECLSDQPVEAEGPTSELPAGALYDADHQCRLQYSSLATSVCSEEEDFCSYLWCYVNGTCTTSLRPPADGTNCGHRKWCMNRECVEVRDSPVAVDGGWGEWRAFTECSRTCGGGVATSERDCDHPKPAHGGLYCTGARKRYRICNTKPCPRADPGFRAQQCASFDPDWKPYFVSGSPCSLYCTNESLIVEAAPVVRDGTPCNNLSNDMCIEGKCRTVGCDWKVDSRAEEDACGVCNGDGSQCITQSNHFSRKDGKGVQAIADIPAEARNIRVEETANSRAFIALGPAEDRLYVDGRRLGKGENNYIPVAGSVATYKRWGHRESLTVHGPTNESLHIYIIYPGKARVKYEYTVKRKPGRVSEFSWQFPDWSACSVTCGTGVQVARPQCMEGDLGPTDNIKCLSAGQPPSQLIRACNLPPCPARWWSGPWQLCPLTCGPWNTRRHRTVLCVRSLEEGAEFQALPDDQCDLATKPPEEEACPGLPKCDRHQPSEEEWYVGKSKTVIKVASTTKPVRPRQVRRHRKRAEGRLRSHQTREEKRFRWHVGEWTHCSTTCGDGIKKRGVYCQLSQSGHRVAAKHCPGKKPVDYEPCNLKPCSEWTVGAWSNCDCEEIGMSTRTVTCPRLNECNELLKPESARSCLESCFN